MVKIFFSYSHKDEEIRNELEIHLAALKHQGLIETWHDRKIPSGSNFDEYISGYLEESDIILFIVTPHFIASDYCYKEEMIRALEMQNNGKAHVIPIIIDSCDWQNTLLGKLKAVPKDGKPVSKYPNRNDALLEVSNAIREIVNKIKKPQSITQEKKYNFSVKNSNKNNLNFNSVQFRKKKKGPEELPVKKEPSKEMPQKEKVKKELQQFIFSSSITEIRKITDVRQLLELEDGLQIKKLSNGVWGYITPWSLPPTKLKRTSGGTSIVEVHKDKRGIIFIVGFVAQSQLISLLDESNKGIREIMFFPKPFKEFSELIAIPMDRIKYNHQRSIEKMTLIDMKIL